MRIIHSLYYGFYLLINTLEKSKDFSKSRAVNGTTIALMLIIASILELVSSIIICYQINTVFQILLSISLSFVANEYYFTYLEKGHEIVEKESISFNNSLSIGLSLISIPSTAYIFVKTMDIAKAYYYMNCN